MIKIVKKCTRYRSHLFVSSANVSRVYARPPNMRMMPCTAR